ncbi:acetyltransferase [Limibacter armeniacum]|uniref:acetyltransferase n=1 Tax=Limibacter armeniacum TaxID=466084 RepID=UPI002FE50F91
MLLYGASGHAKVICSCIESNGVPINGIFDDDISKKLLLSFPVVGPYQSTFQSDDDLIIAIGNNRIRQKVAQTIQHRFGNVSHTSAIIDQHTKVGDGTVVFHQAVIQSDSSIGQHCIINTSASVDHDCLIDNFVHISPKATLCGNVTVGEGSWIGAGATVIQGIKIGKWATIGAGAIITKDVPDYAVVVGSPGKVIKYNNDK